MPADAYTDSPLRLLGFRTVGQQMGGWVGFRSRSYIRSTRVPLCSCPKRLQFSSSGEEGLRLFYALLRSVQTDDCWSCRCTTQFKEEEDNVAVLQTKIKEFLFIIFYIHDITKRSTLRVSLYYFLFSRGILSCRNRLYTNN